MKSEKKNKIFLQNILNLVSSQKKILITWNHIGLNIHNLTQ